MNEFESGRDFSHWFRLLWMILFFFLVFYVVKLIIGLIALVQFVMVLINGEPEPRLKEFSGRINRYGYQIMQFLTFNDDHKPFPFSEFPEAE